MPATAAMSVSVLTTRVVRPWLRTSESASTSLFRREMIQPAFCWEKYRSESEEVLEEIPPQLEHDPLAHACEPEPRQVPSTQAAALTPT